MDNSTPIEAISINFKSDYKSALDSFDKVIDKLKSLQSQLPTLKINITGVNNLEKAGQAAKDLPEEGINKISRLADALTKLSAVSIPTGIASSLRSINKAMNTTGVEGAEKAAEALSKIQDVTSTVQGAWGKSTIAQSMEALTEIAPPVRDMAEYLANSSQAAYMLSSGIEELTGKLLNLKGVMGFTPSGGFTQAFLPSGQTVQGLLPEMSSYYEMHRPKFGDSANDIQNGIASMRALDGEVVKATQDFDKFAVSTFKLSLGDIFGTALGKARAFFSTMRTGFVDVMSYKGKASKSKASMWQSGLVSGMTPFGSLVGRGLKGIGKGMFMPLVKELQYVGKSAMGAAGRLGSFFGSIKRIATYRLIRMALKLISQGLKEGVTNLYEWSKAFDKTHEFAKSMDKIATAALYVKNSLGAMVSPIINTLAPALDWLADKFVALLNIVNEFFAALTGASTYTVAKKVATEFKEAADNTGKATKALKSYTIGIDELNIIEESQGSKSGGNGNSNVASDWFEKHDVSTGMKDFVDSLKKYFQSGDWKGLGTFLGTEFNNLVDKVPWESIGTKAGELFTAGFTTLNAFFDTADFVKFGSKIGSMLNKFFEHADFSQAGEALVGALFSGVDFIGGFLGTVKWGTVTGKISDFFIGGMRKAKKWFENKNWKEVGSKLYEGIKDALNGIKLTELVGSFWDLINGVTTATIDVVFTFLGSWGEDIGNWFYDLSNGQLPDAGEKPIQFIIGGVGADIVEGLVYLAQNGYIDKDLNITVKSIDEGMYNIGEKATPLAPGILMQPDQSGGALGIDMWKSLKKVLQPIADYLIDISDALADCYENFSDFWDKVYNIFGSGNELGLIGTAVEFTKTSFEGDMKDIKYWLDKASKWFGGFSDDVAAAFGIIPMEFTKKWSLLSGKLRYAKAKIELESLKLWNAVKSGFKLKVNQFISILNSAIKGIFKALNKVAKGIDKMSSSGALGMLGGGDIPKIGSVFANAPQIPALARGGVINPNKPFLALLGDQNNGKNIEAPLETIKKALTDVIKEYDASSIAMPGVGDIVSEVRRNADMNARTKSDTENMQRFYEETVLPLMSSIANDTKRQADKDEKTDVYMDSRRVAESVNRQNRANGYSFIR